MKVIVSEEILTIANTGDVFKLHTLLGHACTGRHVILFDPPTAPKTWLGGLDPFTGQAYQTALKNSARSANELSVDVATIRIQRISTPRWQETVPLLPLDEALDVLGEPLGILVENALNDWCFLLGMMRPIERTQVQHAEEKGWLKPLHGGGSTLPAQIKARLNKPHETFRTFVLFDSDRRHPDELATGWSPPEGEACAGYNYQKAVHPDLSHQHWMLKRRSIESYMPEQQIRQACSGNTPPDAVEAFSRLSQQGRWYFNMKQGFDGDQPIQNNSRCRDLYDAVSQEDRNALSKGFGKHLADQYQKAVSMVFHWDDEARREASEALPRCMRLM